MTTTLQTIFSQLKIFNPISNAQKEIKAVLHLYVNAEPQRAKKKLIEDLKQDLSVQHFHCDENIEGLILLYRLLSDYPTLNDFRYSSDSENMKIMHGLLNCFFASDADKAYARQRLGEPKAPIITAPSSVVVDIHITDHNQNIGLAQNMSSVLREMTNFLARLVKM